MTRNAASLTRTSSCTSSDVSLRNQRFENCLLVGPPISRPRHFVAQMSNCHRRRPAVTDQSLFSSNNGLEIPDVASIELRTTILKNSPQIYTHTMNSNGSY